MATLYEQWKDLIENQTEETFEAFWKEYSETETRIYKDLLAHHTEITKGTFKELAEKYGVHWLPSDFKKKNGYKRSVELSAQYGLYRQDYCGCVFSKREREAQRKEMEKQI